MAQGLKKWGSLLGEDLVKNTLKLTSGSVINYIIPIITTPILTRIYTPTDYGVWGVFSSIVTILTVFVCGGYEYAIVEAENDNERNIVTRFCVLTALAFNLIFTIIILLLRLCGLNLFGIGDLIFLAPLYLLISGVLSVFQNYSNAKQFYRSLAMSQVIAGLSLALFRIILGVLKIENGLIYGALLSIIFTSIYLFFYTRNDLIQKCSQVILGIRQVVVKYKNYPLYDAPATFIIYLSNNIPILLLSHFFGKDLLGGYTMVIQLLLLPMSFIGANMGRVYFQQISNSLADIPSISNRVYKISFYLGLAIIVFFLLGGDYLLYIILGNDWEIAGEYALYLSLWSFFTIAYAPLKPIYRVLKEQRTQMLLMIIAFVVQTLYLYLAAKYFRNISVVIFFYSIVCSIFKVIEGVVLKKFTGLNTLYNQKYLLIISVLVVLAWTVRSIFRLGVL